MPTGDLMDVVFGDRKRGRNEITLSGVPFSQQLGVAKRMAADGEYGENRRAKAYIKRLHMAKYLKCDRLLKELFFPTLTMAHRFGFCSVTGIEGRGAAALGDTGAMQPVQYSKAAGLYRGIAMFTLRSCTQSLTDESNLNSNQIQTGQTSITGSQLPITSGFRRFNSRPELHSSDTRNGAAVETTVPPTVTHNMLPDMVIKTTPHDANTLYVPAVGNINELETKAIQSSNFQHAIGSSSSSEGTTSIGTRSGLTGVNWDGNSVVYNDRGAYYANLKNTTIRISDGYLEMDISNGKTTSTYIEVVIHSFKKNANGVGTQQLMNAIHNAVQYQQSDRNVSTFYSDTSNSATQQPGGWQAFWDPTYPFLGVKSQHRKPVDAIANEVHRSVHMLGPGQSKLVKIHLGSLYYDLGSKCDNGAYNTSDPSPLGFPNPTTGVGALNVSIGHSGVMHLSAPSDPSGGVTANQFANYPDSYEGDAIHDHTGAGFWVGKAFCPSEIVVTGNYVEKFYPAYVVDKERRNWSDRPMLPPTVSGRALPTALPVTNTIGTVAVSGQAIPAAINSQKSEL
jgi:hypothetical protein